MESTASLAWVGKPNYGWERVPIIGEHGVVPIMGEDKVPKWVSTEYQNG